MGDGVDRTASIGAHSFASEDTEDAFERAAHQEVQDPKNKDMLGHSDELDIRPPPLPAVHHLPDVAESDEYSEGLSHGGSRRGGHRGAADPYGQSYLGSESVGRSYDSSSPERDFRRHPYSSPYRRSQDTYGSDSYYDSRTNASLDPRASEEYRPEESTSPTGLPGRTRRPQTARNFQPAGQSAGGISEATSYQEPGQHTGAGARLRRILQNMMERDPRTWDAGEVLYWLDFVGLSQHRYKFSHHAVDGRMLLKLTDEMLRKFIGIHSLGQRQQIMECIEDLKDSINPQERVQRQRPASAPSATVIDQISRLQRELDKASQRAAQQRSLADEAARRANLADKDVEALRKQLAAMRREAKQAGREVDSAEKPDWQPLGKNTARTHWDPNPKLYGTNMVVPDRQSKPRMNKESKKLMSDRDPRPMWERYEGIVDQRRKALAKKEKELLEQGLGADAQSKQQQRNIEFVSEYFVSNFNMDIPTNNNDRDKANRILAQSVETYQDEIMDSDMKEEQRERVKARLRRLKGDALVEVVADLLRVKEFMANNQRRLNVKRSELRERYEKETAKVERLEDAEDREAMYRDLGWLGDDDVEGGGISSDRLGALLKRARVFKILDEEAEAAMKAAVAAAEEDGDEVDNEAGAGADFTVNVDDPRFKDISADGLEELQDNHGNEGKLDHVVGLLKHCRHEDLAKGMRMRCDAEEPADAANQRRRKADYVYKLFRMQRYLRSYEEDMRRREAKMRQLAMGELYGTMPVKAAPRGQYDGFMQRLDEDLENRKTRQSEGMGISGAQARQLKQEDILKSSVLFQRNQQPAGGSPSSKGTPRGT